MQKRRVDAAQNADTTVFWNYEEDRENPLCLCEYYNKQNKRSHMLMCCCNCEALDELCTQMCCMCCCCCRCGDDVDLTRQSATTERQFTERLRLAQELCEVLADRARVPFPGGARRISCEYVLTFVGIYIYILVGTLNFAFTILVIVLVPFAFYAYFFMARLKKSRSASNSTARQGDRIQIAHFMLVNVYLCILLLYSYLLRDELSVTISEQESALFYALYVGVLGLHLYLHKHNPGVVSNKESYERHLKSIENDNNSNMNNNEKTSSVGGCPECNAHIYKRDHHCYWIDNCVGYLNHKPFLAYLILLYVTFVYSFLIMLRYFSRLNCKMLMFSSIPKDGSFSCLFDVYYSSFARATLTLLFVQAIPVLVYMPLLLAQQLLFISIGLTQQQLYKLSKRNVRFSLTLFIRSKLDVATVIRNWRAFIKARRATDIEIILRITDNTRVSSYNLV
jgi:palmitoyltransferase